MDIPFCCGPPGGRLGDRPEVHRRVHATAAQRADRGGNGASFWLLGQALRTLPVGTAYAVWTGIGAVGTAIFGIVLFADSTAWPQLLSILFIVVGILGLKFTAYT